MALTAEQMAAMSALLDQALELDAAGRERWLQALDPKHRELEPALRLALLGDGPGLSTSPRLSEPPGSGAQPGVLIGPYRLVRPLGEGGMAEVWLAQRADGAYQREVALKLPAAVLRQDLASRFARERDILAKLEHPNIARLYDAGVGAEGQPYLAMEFVAGRPLNTWCDGQRLGVRERLQLFLQVLDAVQYAHGQQVIHRDLKPSNILVTEAGQVRLLDFGVAKLLAQPQESTQLTQLYGQAMTPQYASPEQLRGEEVSAASDVYSLGVLLYELLAGALPYKLKAGASAGLLEQAVVTAQVQRPSTQVDAEAAQARSATPSQLSRRLQGDLDAIVLKALAKEPAQRYDSATALAEDLRRYLAGEPVLARPDRPLYRISKCVGRHPVGVAASAVATVLVVVATVYEVSHRPAPASGPTLAATANPVAPGLPATAVAADDKSIAVLPFVDMSEKHDQEYFSDGLSEELIERLAQSAELKVISRTSSFYFKGKQVTAGEIAKTLGVAHLLEGSVRKSGNELRVTAQLIRAADGSHLWSQSYDRKLTDIFKVQGEIARAVAQALKFVMGRGGSGADMKPADTEAYNLLLQGNFYLKRHTKVDAERATVLFKEAIQRDPSYGMAWASLASAYRLQAWSGWAPRRERVGMAREAANTALRARPAVALAHRVLGDLYAEYDWNWGLATAEYERALNIDPADEGSRHNLLFYTDFVQGRLDPLIDFLHQSIQRDPLNTGARWGLSWGLFDAGRAQACAAEFRRLLELNASSSGAQAGLGACLLYLGSRSEALEAAQKETDEPWRLTVLASIFWEMGRGAESDAALHELEQKHTKTFGWAVASVHAYRGETDAAFEWLNRAYRERDPGMTWIKVNPWLRRLHGDPRFQAILVKMRLSEPRPDIGPL
jgi:serine/threonine protein kinase/TolB-like protein